jgi:hypothetical protein
MNTIEIIHVSLLILMYLVGGYSFWDDVIDWKKANWFIAALLVIFWLPVILTLLVTFSVKELFSFAVKKVRG